METEYHQSVRKNPSEMPSIYGRPEWKRLRRLKLREQPLCESCRMARSCHVDHIKAHKGNDALFLDYTNLQALCSSCHSKKTVARDGGFGGKSASDKPAPGIGADGWPIAREHHWNK